MKPNYKIDSLPAIARSLIERINHFDDTCKADEYTDTGEVWTLLDSIRDDLAAGLRGKP